MRLNSTGLGIGTTAPARKLDVTGTFGVTGAATFGNAGFANGIINANDSLCFAIDADSDDGNDNNNFLWLKDTATGSGGTTLMTLRATGNLGLGVTPSAWRSNYKALQINTTGAVWSAPQYTYFSDNNYQDSSDVSRYLTTAPAAMYALNRNAGVHAWYNAPSGTAGDAITFTQAMTLTAAGNLGLGTSSPANFGGRTALEINNATDGGLLNLLVNGTRHLTAYVATGAGLSLIGTASNTDFGFLTNNTERARFNTTGAFVFAGGTTTADGIGITFPATQSASTNANTLDDYEEGTWTPRLSGTSGGDYTPSGINDGRYIKIGKMVWATCTLQWSAQVTAFTGSLAVTGLPFTSGGIRAVGSMGAINSGLVFTAGYGEWNYLMDPGYAFVYIIQNSTTGAGYSHNPTVQASGVVYALSIVYQASN